MNRTFLGMLGVVACSFLLAIPLQAANPVPAKTPHNAIAASRENTWPAEALSGTIMTVDPAQRLVIIQTADGVPFDMVVTRSTRIEAGARELTLDQLKSDTNRNVSVRFVPERSGDIARTIQING